MPLDQLLERDGHLLLNRAGVVDVSRNVEKLGAGVPGASEGGEPSSAPPENIQIQFLITTICFLFGVISST